jgi:hypothetical protein
MVDIREYIVDLWLAPFEHNLSSPPPWNKIYAIFYPYTVKKRCEKPEFWPILVHFCHSFDRFPTTLLMVLPRLPTVLTVHYVYIDPAVKDLATV